MDRKTYMKNIYSKHWITARDKKNKKYGVSSKGSLFDKNLCEYICKNVSREENILEVAIGTGFPFGNFFQNKRYKVHGIDISPTLIEKCKKLNNKINCKVGEAENLEYPDNFFNCTYCFHSTYYFSDLCKAIDEMIRVTIPNGMIIFDIANRNNNQINQNYNKMLSEKRIGFRILLRYARNIAKIIFRKGTPDWTNVVYQVPAYPETLYRHLKKANIKNYGIITEEKLIHHQWNSKYNDNLEIRNAMDSFKDCRTIVFVLWK